MFTGMILIDLQIAFDTIDHEICGKSPHCVANCHMEYRKALFLAHSFFSFVSMICLRQLTVAFLEGQLDKNFNSLCDWFVDNKLSIHFGENKTKSILFVKTNKKSGNKKLDIRSGCHAEIHTTPGYSKIKKQIKPTF